MWQKIKNNLIARWWRLGALKHIPEYQRKLSAIVSQSPHQKTLIFPPGLGWQESLFQRPQHLAQALASQDMLVFYVVPETSNQLVEFDRISENLFLCHIPLQTFDILPEAYVFTMTWNYKFAAQLRHAGIIYDYVDHLQAFTGNLNKLEQQHRLLLKCADFVMATSVPLLREVQPLRPDAILCPNGVDYDHFVISNSYQLEPPIDIAPLVVEGKPLIGYSGALAQWLDYELIETVAQLRHDLHFLLIGPDHDRTLPTKLLQTPNLSWIGAKPYQDLPVYMHFFDVAMIPFCVNDLTDAVSPLKLFEYMAAGKPVVTTPTLESMRYPGVLIARDQREFSKRLDEALELRSDQHYLQTIQQVAKENTWEARARQIKGALVGNIIPNAHQI